MEEIKAAELIYLLMEEGKFRKKSPYFSSVITKRSLVFDRD